MLVKFFSFFFLLLFLEWSVQERRWQNREISSYISPRIVVCPVVQFLVNPRQQAHGGVMKAISCCLGFCRLNHAIPRTLFEEPLRSLETLTFRLTVRSQCMLE